MVLKLKAKSVHSHNLELGLMDKATLTFCIKKYSVAEHPLKTGFTANESLMTYEPCHEEFCFFAYAKKELLISCAVTTQLISAFVFATWLNSKPLAIFCGYTAQFVSNLVRNPEDRFSQDVTHI